MELTLTMMIPFVLGQSYVLLLPLFVEKELHSGPQVFGALSACLGAGAVVGATAVATFGKQRQIGFLMFLGILGTGIATIVYCPVAVARAHRRRPARRGDVPGDALRRLRDAARRPPARRHARPRPRAAVHDYRRLPGQRHACRRIADVIGLRPLALIEGVIIVAMASVAWRVTLRHAAALRRSCCSD